MPLAALAPKPRVSLARYHGLLAPNHRWRGFVTPAKRGKGAKRIANTDVRSPTERHVAMSWAQRLKRVFNIDIEVCGVIVKSGVSASELGGDLVHCFHLDSIFEFNPGNHLCQVAKAA